MKYILIQLSLIAYSVTSFGQTPSFSIGPRIGLNIANTDYKTEVHSFTSKSIVRGDLGGTAHLHLKYAALQASLLYSQKGFRLDDEYYASGPGIRYTTRERYKLNYLTVPINVAFSQKNGQGFQVFVGGYVAMLLSGQMTYDNQTESRNLPTPSYSRGEKELIPGNEYPGPYNKQYAVSRWDAGVQGGVGFRFQDTLIQLGYSVGLRNLYPLLSYREAPIYYTRAAQLSVTYLFKTTVSSNENYQTN